MGTILISVVITATITGIIIFFYCKNHYYFKGRYDGWAACENMAIKRAKEHNYNTEKFFSNILS